MSKKLNPKGTDGRVEQTVRVAGGAGAKAARQDSVALLKRAVFACLLFEDLAYQTGKENADNIASLVAQVEPEVVAQIAIDSREKQKLRHVPLWLIVNMLKYEQHKKFVREVINKVITRPDQMTDLLALYWKYNNVSGENAPLPYQLKMGLADVFAKFNEYSLAKYDRDGAVKLRDVLRLVHPVPASAEKSELYSRVKNRTLATPETWEVLLSSGADKKFTWTRLIQEEKLGGLAFLRNMRNMVAAGVDEKVIRQGLSTINVKGLLPLNFFSAAKYAPAFSAEVEEAFFRAYSDLPKLSGTTIFIDDVSGSMENVISGKSEFTRMDIGKVLSVLARERAEYARIFVTAGSDYAGTHKTQEVPSHYRGFALADEITRLTPTMGGGGIFTRQCLEYIRTQVKETPDRIIVFSDSADMDRTNRMPAPFGKHNYIIDVSAHSHGINYKGVWDAEISGHSESFLDFIAASEGLETASDEQE